jgi:transposase-like protein
MEVARTHGVAASTVYAWARRLRVKRTELEVAGGEVAAPAVTLAKVERVPRRPTTTASTVRGIVADVNGIQIRVERAEDVPLAAALARALAPTEARG